MIKSKKKIAIVGNPNSGKTTFFNGLTGTNQKVGNWPGVTVEKTTGYIKIKDTEFEVIDLPGIYSLTSDSIDEKIARDFIISRDYDAIINIVDASNLERNLFLTLNLIEMNVPIILLLNKIDLVSKNKTEIDVNLLSKEISLPLFTTNATKKEDIENFKIKLLELLDKTKVPPFKMYYHNEIEEVIHKWEDKINYIAKEINISSRWISIKLLEKDELIIKKVIQFGALTEENLKKEFSYIENVLKDSPEVLIASQKFAFIKGLTKQVIIKKIDRVNISDIIDKIVINKFLGIPLFFIIMYLMFAIVMNIGGAFIDFFNILFGTIFVDGIGNILSSFLKAPNWIINLVSNGIGAGIQTVSTFIPVMFMMFFMLSLLEDSGYMARAAFVMDRFMRLIGLPGKAFVPMIVGFGCTVPAVMGARVLENNRERYLTVFITPLMSCSARLPVYVFFSALFFPKDSGIVIFSLYLVGILIAIFTGLFLKKILFKGEASYFVMELPPYNPPRLKHIMIHTWIRLKAFILRAGKNIIIVVTILGFLNSFTIDTEKKKTFLGIIGEIITPVFTPLGIEKENWPATIGLFTGLFAKEAIVGTLTGIYSQMEAQKEELQSSTSISDEKSFNFIKQIKSAFITIPENLKELGNSFINIFIFTNKDQKVLSKELEVKEETLTRIKERFNNQPLRIYAYLLFVLIYFPCVAAFSTIIKEIGIFYGILSAIYLTVLGWSIGTLFFQVTIGHLILWEIIAIIILFIIGLILYLIGRKKVIED